MPVEITQASEQPYRSPSDTEPHGKGRKWKFCRGPCEQVKLVGAFQRKLTSSDGLQSWCRACSNARWPARSIQRRVKRLRERGGKQQTCRSCYGLPRAVKGPNCRGCGLAREAQEA